METQTNPYLVWQLIPGIALLVIGLYILGRPVKRRESNAFMLVMFAGSLWAFGDAVQVASPNMAWQAVWGDVKYIGIMLIPTAWFLLAVNLTGLLRRWVKRFENYLWVFPALMYLALLANGYHHLFFSAPRMSTDGGYALLKYQFGILFYVHTAYSYLALVAGIVLLAISLVTRFKKYGAQAYGLILGVAAPLVGNAYFLFGSPPPGFPDPTPLLFTITGVAFAWAIFSGRILEVVPLAHETIVRKLSTGVLVLDADKNIRDINDAARDMLGLTARTYAGDPLATLVEKNPSIAAIADALDSSASDGAQIQFGFPDTRRTFDLQISPIGDDLDQTTGWLIQFNDITERLKTQSDLKKSQSSYVAVLETLQDPYFEILRTGQFSYVNRALCNWTNYSREELLGRHFRVVASRKSVRETALKHEAMFKDGKPIPPFDFIYRRKDGQEFTSEMVVSPIIEDGVVVGTRGIIRDISVRIQAEEVLRQAKEAAESRAGELAAINRLAATVSRSLDFKDILQSVCTELTSIFEIRNAGIGLLTPDKKFLKIIAFHAIDPNETSALDMLLPLEGNTSSLEVIRTKKTVVIQDAQNDPRTDSVSDISRQRGTKAIMIVPLLARGGAIGTIGMPASDPNHIFTREEIELAETIASQIAAAVDNAQLHAKTESALGAAERDLEIGRQIQSGFFPEKLPDVPGWEIAAQFRAARQVAGDFYDVFKFKNSEFVAFIIADVCDKGVGAALFMVLFRSLLRAFSGTQVDKQNVRERLLHTIVSTNNFIAEYHGKSNMFATLFFGILDPESGVLHYVNGGHEPPVVLDAEGKIVQRLMPTGPAVGMFADLDFRVERVRFREDDVLVSFTDGTTDAKNTSGAQFSEERLLKAITAPSTSVFSLLFELDAELQRHIGEQPQFDDITLLSFRRKAKEEVNQHAICRPARMEILPELRNFVESAAAFCGLSHEDGFAFKLAADEICTNIVQYGFKDREPGLLSLFFSKQDSLARLIIRDDGTHFSPDQAKSPDTEADWNEREIGGLGIYFVKELMDNVTYNYETNGVNQFVLEKKIKESNRAKE